MTKRNIIGMVSGEPDLVARWKAVAPERIIARLDLKTGGGKTHSHVKARTAEVMAQYEGIPANDERLEPYWALAEELGIPVAIHELWIRYASLENISRSGRNA